MIIKNSKILAAALSLGLVLTACGNNKDAAKEAPANEPAATDKADDKKTEPAKDDKAADDKKTDEKKTDEKKDDKATGNNSVEDYDFTVVSREDGSGTRGAFIELVGLEEEVNGQKEDKTTSDAIVQNSTNGVMQTVSQDSNAIGYISLGSLNDTVKAVKVDGVEATEENIENGTYKLARPFNLAYKEADLDDLSKDFLDYCLSTDAQKIVKDHGYVPLKDTKDYKASDISGKITVAGSTSVTPLMEAFIEAYKGLNPNATIELQSTGSSAGIEAAIDGAAQIAMASRDLKDDEKDKLKVEVIATDGIAVIVNKDSKLEELTIDQLKNIFNGTIANTSELSK